MAIFSLVIKFEASLLECLVYVVWEVVEEMSGNTWVQRVRKGHLDIVYNLALVLTKLLDFPLRIETFENPAVVSLWQNPVGILIGYSRNVGEAELWEANLDFPVKFPWFWTSFFHGNTILYNLAWVNPRDEFVIVLDIFDYFEEVFLGIGQDLACFELNGLLFELSEKGPHRKREELLLVTTFLIQCFHEK